MGRDGRHLVSVVDNGRFYVLPEYTLDDQKTAKLTLEEHTVTQVRTDQECCSAEITARGSINDKPAWTLRKKASRAEIFGRFYRTVTPGCCGSATRYAYFDPITGNQSFIATEPIAALEVVGTYRFSRYLALNTLSGPGDNQFAVQIQYGPQSGPTQVAYLTFAGEDIAAATIKVQYFRDGKLENSTVSDQEGTYPIDFTLFPPGYPSNRNVSADDISAFSFVLSVEGQPTIRIPVVKDHLDFSSAVLPKGFQISETVPAEFAKELQDERK
jgi:hypothetical protein